MTVELVINSRVHGTHVVHVDDGDADVVTAHSWHIDKESDRLFYARSSIKINGVWVSKFMHNLLTGWSRVDHVDHNGLNNCRFNLRETNCSLNGANRRSNQGSSSKFKGVTWNKQKKKWMAAIKTGGVSMYLGYFTDPVNAAHVYDTAAMELFGEHAGLNFPEVTFT